jgi:hypothetical protein
MCRTTNLLAVGGAFLVSILIANYNVVAQSDTIGRGRSKQEGGGTGNGWMRAYMIPLLDGGRAFAIGAALAVTDGGGGVSGGGGILDGGSSSAGGYTYTDRDRTRDGIAPEGGGHAGGNNGIVAGGTSSTGESIAKGNVKPNLSVANDYGGRGMPPVHPSTIATTRAKGPEGGSTSSGGYFLSPLNLKKQHFISALHPCS